MKALKIGWILDGSEVVPGARIQGFNIHRQLLGTGVNSVILRAPPCYSLALREDELDWRRVANERLDVVVFRKVYQGEAEKVARRCREQGIRTVYLASDWCGTNMVRICDAAIAVSPFLKDAFGRRLAGKITVVPDALEVPRNMFKTDYGQQGERLKAVYVGSSMPGDDILRLLSCIKARIELTVISSGYHPTSDNTDTNRFRPSPMSLLTAVLSRSMGNMATVLAHKLRTRLSDALWRANHGRGGLPEFRFVEWRLDTVMAEVIQHDVAVIPCRLDSSYSLAKSANRLTMFMALGMPVIASPVPSYVRIIEDGVNGFLASSNRGWLRACEAMRWVETKKRIGERARQDVVEMFAPEAIALRYLAVFRGDSAG